MTTSANEDLTSLTVARRELLPQLSGRPVSPPTLYRWIRKGALAGDGTRVRLKAVKIGRSFMVTRSAAKGFLNELARRSSLAPKQTVNVQAKNELARQGLI